MKVTLHIDELVLEGFAPAEAARVAAAIERELGHRLASAPLPPSLLAGGEIASLDLGTLRLPTDAPEATGARVAAHVDAGWRR
jgi:hypothetical protein